MQPTVSPAVDFRAYLAEVGGEGFLSFLEGLDLARGYGLEVGFFSFQPRPLGADLPEGRLLLRPPRLADGHLQSHTVE